MKKKIGLLLAVALVTAALPAGLAQARAPLSGVIEYEQVLAPTFDGTYLLAWEGTISGDIEGCVEWWIDTATWTAWPYILAGEPVPNATHYTEYVVVFNCQTREMYLEMLGYGNGTTTLANASWRDNGVVIGAYGEFSEWEGRRVHQRGTVTFTAPPDPWFGTGTFRVN